MSPLRTWMNRNTVLAILAIPAFLTLSTVGGCPALEDLLGGGNTNTNTNTNDNSSGNTNTNTNTNDNGSTVIPGNSGLTGKFVGSSRCQLCHANIHADWTGTLHAKAYDTLEAIGQQNNAQCIGCHTVGFGEAGGWVDRATTNDLAGVGCEACHPSAGDHAKNASDVSLRPKADIAASVCGRCHTDEHHPNYDDWQLSKHAAVEPELVPSFAAGSNLSTCGKCHSGDYFYHAIIKGETVAADYLKGKTSEQMNAITCAICHNPHKRTGNASTPDEGRDYQLRYPEVAFPIPTNTLAAAQDPTRFNICGQCHHARDRVWTDSSREPHPSDQANVFFGEMPLPTSKPDPIVPSRPSVHLNTPDQCRTCHVFRKPIEEGVAPAVSGHTFEPNFEACAQCHGSAEVGEAKFEGLKVEIQIREDRVIAALNAWATKYPLDGKGLLSWEYTSEGGPSAAVQAKIPDDIKKARYLYYYVKQGGANGVHNPDYVRDALVNAEEYARNAPAPLP
ncbi:MAG: multiheme c-type cytochrome [Phycisphaerae bacterium]